MRIYLAQYLYDEARICSVKVVKETAKQYQIDPLTVQPIMRSMYVGRSVNKSSDVFLTLDEAHKWCLEQAESRLAILERQIDRVRQDMRMLKILTEPAAEQ